MEEINDIVESAAENGRLDLSHRGFDYFEDTIFGLCFTLAHLNLSHNAIKVVPHQIGCLEALQEFILDSNKLSSIPDEIGQLKKLRILDLRKNEMSELNQKISGCILLEELYIDDNLLEALPKEISHLKILTKLTAERNKLKLIPSELCFCISIEVVRFKGNEHVSNIPHSALNDARIVLFLCAHYQSCETDERERMLHLEKIERQLQKEQERTLTLKDEVEKLKAYILDLEADHPFHLIRLKKQITKGISKFCCLSNRIKTTNEIIKM